LKTCLDLDIYGSTLGLILSAALGRTRPAGIATGAIAFAVAGVLLGWLLQNVYAAFAEHGVVFFPWFSIVNVGTWFLAINAFLWFIRDRE
jgi:mannose/fructose/N-acetylgalactosamine-specific phosphotransferase system component IIC